MHVSLEAVGHVLFFDVDLFIYLADNVKEIRSLVFVNKKKKTNKEKTKGYRIYIFVFHG